MTRQILHATRAPFHFEATVRVLQRRPTNRVDIWEQDRYLRVLPVNQTPVLVEVRNPGSIDDPQIRVSVLSGATRESDLRTLTRTLRSMLGLDVDPGPLQRFANIEPRLRSIVLALRGMRPPRFADLFESFVSVVPFQQLSLEAGIAVLGRIVERFGEPLEHGGRTFYAFPTAARIARSRASSLRACGLSTSKAETLRRIARACESGELSAERVAELPTPEALDKLAELPGIGRWSAALVLLRGLGRLDVFPPGDVGATRALSALLQRAPGEPLTRFIGELGDERGYLYFLGLGEDLLKKKLIHPAPSDAEPPRTAAERLANRELSKRGVRK